MIAKFKFSVWLLVVLVAYCCILTISTASTTTTPSPDLNTTTHKRQNTTITQAIEGRTKLDQDTESSGQVQQIKGSSRGGRMLDLDHLAGDIGKGEKIAKERLQSGSRQSRILSEDIALTGATSGEQRSKKSKSKKKMAIKGFIPIVSLENAKEGKHLETGMDSMIENEPEDEDQEQEEQEQSQQHPYASSQTKEQIMSSYGGQTSLGHASFGVQPSEQMNQGQQQSTGSTNNWQQMTPTDYGQAEAGRARKLLGSSGILSGLTTPGRKFVSSLVPSNHPTQALQAPMNIPPQMLLHQQQQQQQQSADLSECICVPFFQCKNGYLSESQLTKNQLNQYQAQSAPLSMHQIPRAINLNEPLVSKTDLTNYQQQISTPMLAQFTPEQREQLNQLIVSNQQANQNGEQQNVNDAIYEQLRKTIEANNLEQQLLQQQQQQQQQPATYMAIDERSKGASNETTIQISNNTTQTGEGEEVLERSFLNPLGMKRNGVNQKSCGIMRTCCKVPPYLSTSYQQQFGRPSPNQLQHSARFVNNRPQSNHYHQPQPQYQMLHPASSQHNHLSQPSSTLVNHDLYGNQQPSAQSIDYQAAPSLVSNSHNNLMASQPPVRVGNFMAGRCGMRQAMGISGRVQNSQPGSESTTEFGEFPSHAAILKRLSPGDSMFVCSAVLISNQWLATAAHCVRKHRIDELKVRLGEWDVNKDDEFYPFVEANIRDIIIHPDFQPSSLMNDIALLRIEQTVTDFQQMPHIGPVCLPSSDEIFDEKRCFVAGYGKDAFDGKFQSVLKKVDLPVVNRQICENALRFGTKLGKFFRLHQSAICAGGERGKDACEGDGGAGLYCHDPESGITKVAGLVSWGIGCGQKGIPGVYTNMAAMSGWIEQVVANSGEENLYMDRNSVGSSESLFKNVVSERNNKST